MFLYARERPFKAKLLFQISYLIHQPNRLGVVRTLDKSFCEIRREIGAMNNRTDIGSRRPAGPRFKSAPDPSAT